MAVKKGYKNVKVFTQGLPAWKKAKQPVYVNNSWLAKNLDKHHVIIDVRSSATAQKSRIKSAIVFSVPALTKMGQEFAAKKAKYAKRILPSLTDKKAPIIIYGDNTSDANVIAAFKELVSWRYKGVTILNGGFKEWHQKGLAVESGSTSSQIVYEKKMIPGAVSPNEFVTLIQNGKAVILDVRSNKEVKKGKIKNSIHIPLETLEKNLGKLSKSSIIVAHCATGMRADMAYNILKNNGFTKAKFLNSNIHIDKSGHYTID